MSISLTKENYYPPHLLAQKLNNRASVLLTTGKYEEGIRVFTKALKLTDLEQTMIGGDGHYNKQAPCKCKACTLESCLTIDDQESQDKQHQTGLVSENDYSHHLQDGQTQGGYVRNNTNTTTRSRSGSYTSCDDDQYQSSPASSRLAPVYLPHVVESSSPFNQTTTDDNDIGFDGFNGFVYKRPLLVNKKCIEEMHYMGITLSLIILLNLALAYHLKATTIGPYLNKNLRVLEQALQLYELAYQLNVKHQASMTMNSCDEYYDANSTASRSIGSLRFTMIVSNNLGEIHRFIGSKEKQTMCLQHLLSIIIYMVDSKLGVMDSKEMDGFYDNVSPLMLNDICAKPA